MSEVSGTFIVDGSFNFHTAQQVEITLGPDTFSLPGGQFSEKNGVYSCRNADSGNGLGTAKFDTLQCPCSIEVTNTSNGSGEVYFSADLFGNALQDPDSVEQPLGFRAKAQAGKNKSGRVGEEPYRLCFGFLTCQQAAAFLVYIEPQSAGGSP